MRYRFATAADLPTCRRLLDAGFHASAIVRPQIVRLWQGMLESGSGRLSVIEDPERRHPEAIEAFGACVFVSDSFVAEFSAAPRPYLSAIIYERMLRGQSPLLSVAQQRGANSGMGLNLVCLHFALRDPVLGHPRTREVLQVANTAFFFFVGGYRIKCLMQEVYGDEHAAYMDGGGLRLRTDFADHFAQHGDRPAARDHPRLFGLRRDEILPVAVNPLSYLFHPLAPRFGFTTSAQRVLEQALLMRTDEEIAAELRVSLDAVKKTWRAIYARTDSVAPRLFGACVRGLHDHHRRAERRRYLLDYLRTHLEELRPVNRRVVPLTRPSRALSPAAAGPG
jgi:hypothetical protein